MQAHRSFNTAHSHFPSPNTNDTAAMRALIPGMIWALGTEESCMVSMPVPARVTPEFT